MSDKISIVRDNGEIVQGIAPVIISASRSTDIPAFYAKWFINRLEKGYCVWYNPFNHQKLYISFKQCKVIVFWTKNPKPIIPYLHELDKRGINYYFQVTLNNYEKEGFEPNVPSLEERIEIFKHLSNMIGKEKIIWRFDPLIVSKELTPRKLLNRIYHLGNALKGCTDKLVFSFIDIKDYRKVQNNLIKETNFFEKEHVNEAEFNVIQKNEIAEGLLKLKEHWRAEGWNLEMATCAENIDLEKYEIHPNRCIDGELMERLFSTDQELVYYLHTGKLPEKDIFGLITELPLKNKNMKDKGQRKVCGCIVSKDIGMYNTCRHFCVYCYANTSKKCVLDNQAKHSFENESIIE